MKFASKGDLSPPLTNTEWRIQTRRNTPPPPLSSLIDYGMFFLYPVLFQNISRMGLRSRDVRYAHIISFNSPPTAVFKNPWSALAYI